MNLRVRMSVCVCVTLCMFVFWSFSPCMCAFACENLDTRVCLCVFGYYENAMTNTSILSSLKTLGAVHISRALQALDISLARIFLFVAATGVHLIVSLGE